MRRLNKYASYTVKIRGIYMIKQSCEWWAFHLLNLNSSIYRMAIDMTKIVNEMKTGQENESHLSLKLASERQTIDSTSKSLSKCETLLKRVTDKNDQLVQQNATLADEVGNLHKQHSFSCEWIWLISLSGCWTEKKFGWSRKTWGQSISGSSVCNCFTKRNAAKPKNIKRKNQQPLGKC